MAKFIAQEMGFYRNRRIRKGEVFDAPDDFKGKWAIPAIEVAEKKAIPAGKGNKGTLGAPAKGDDLA